MCGVVSCVFYVCTCMCVCLYMCISHLRVYYTYMYMCTVYIYMYMYGVVQSILMIHHVLVHYGQSYGPGLYMYNFFSSRWLVSSTMSLSLLSWTSAPVLLVWMWKVSFTLTARRYVCLCTQRMCMCVNVCACCRKACTYMYMYTIHVQFRSHT